VSAFEFVPTRMARILQHPRRNSAAVRALIESVQGEPYRVPLANRQGRAVGDGALLDRAEKRARQCEDLTVLYRDRGAIVRTIEQKCARESVLPPLGQTEGEQIARACNKNWWFSRLKRDHIRRWEGLSVGVGSTGEEHDPYISHEAALRIRKWNVKNAALLESTEVMNENGEIYTLMQLADKGISNKKNRRNDLMVRIRGMEDIAATLKHVALFWTITTPSKFHSQGGQNPKYNGATPRQAQAYLCKAWARMRAAFKRKNIAPYGFRIAEPHLDGCPHWHMLLFVAPDKVEQMEAIIRRYALAEDGDEAGAKEHRVTLVKIEQNRGSAAGYIVKYVCKNIDGSGVGEHKTQRDGQTWRVLPDLFGNEELHPTERVTAWAQLWGIRQFQQIAGAPVTVWRELRRISAESLIHAPEDVRTAWHACQKINADKAEDIKRADFAAYVMAQGGVNVGRCYRIRIKYEEVETVGRYGMVTVKKPFGIFAVSDPKKVYPSIRYTWTLIEKAGGGYGAWTGVNNCTPNSVKYPHEFETHFNEPAPEPEISEETRERWREFIEEMDFLAQIKADEEERQKAEDLARRAQRYKDKILPGQGLFTWMNWSAKQ